MELLEYTEKSFIVLGEKTKDCKEDLKQLGGRYNPHLTHPQTKEKLAAWIFSKKNHEKLKQYINSGYQLSTDEVKPVRKPSSKKKEKEFEPDEDPIQRLGLKDNGHVDVKKTRKPKSKEAEKKATTEPKAVTETILISQGMPEIQDIPGFSTVVPVVGMQVKFINKNKESFLTITSTKKENGFTFEFQASNTEQTLDFVMVGKVWKQLCVKDIQHLSFVH